MKNKNKKAFLLVKLLALMSIVSVIGYQLAFGISGIFAQEQSLSLTTEFDSEELAADEQFTVKISDQRSISEIVTTENTDLPYVDQSQSLTETSSSEVSIKREYTMVLPEGISFDQTIQNEWQTEMDYTGALPEFSFDENSRELKISVDASATEVGIRLTATAAGSYQLQVKDANLTESSEAVTVEVGEAKVTDSEDETATMSVEAPTTRAIALASATTVTTWDEFVAAFGDASVSQIVLGANISLSGTITDTHGVFDKTSVDLSSAYGYLYVTKAQISRTVVIDGGGYTFDFGNLGIGFTNASVNTSSYWNITMQNINVKSANPYAPFFYPVLTAAGTQGITTASYLTNSKLTYGTGYNHVKDVKTWQEFYLAFANRSVSTVNLVTDIVLPRGTVTYSGLILPDVNNQATTVFADSTRTNAPGTTTWSYITLTGSAREMVVEGNGYTLDLGGVTLCFRDATTNNGSGNFGSLWYQTFRNITFYHGNYWGAIILNDISATYQRQSWQKFENFTHYGAQLIQAENSQTIFAGDIHIQQMATYTPLGKAGNVLRTDGSGTNGNQWSVDYSNNQTLGVWQTTFEDNANVYLSSLGGPVIDLYSGGNVSIGNNVTMTAVREGTQVSGDGTGAVFAFRGGSLTVGEGSTVNLNSTSTSSQTAIISMNSSTASIDIQEGATVNLNRQNNTTSGDNNTSNPIYMGGGSINVNGTLNVTGTGMGASSTNMIYSTSNVSFVIGKNGSLDVKSDSTSTSQSLLYFSGSSSTFQFSDAKRVNLQRTATMTSATATNNGLIYSGGNLGVSVQNVYQWTRGNTASGTTGDGGYTYGYEPMSSMNLSYSGITPTITAANSMTTATLNSFKTNFTTRGQQRVLFTQILNPSVAIHNEPNDNPTSADSHTVSGYAIPGTYIRVWEEALNGTTSAKANGTADNVASPVEDTTMPATTRANYTTISDSNGDWSVDLTTLGIDKTFTAENVIHVYAFSNLKSEEVTAIVLDKTPPTGTVSAQTTYNDVPIAASAFVDSASIADTNPTLTLPTDITISFDQATTNADAYTWLTNGTGTLTKGEYAVGINLTDPAGNTTTYATTLTVKNYSKDIVISMVNEAGATINADLVPNQATTYTATVPEDDTSLTISDDADLVSFIQAIIATGYYQLADENWQAGTINFTDLTATFAFQGVLKFGDVTSALKFEDTRISFIDQTVLPEDDFDMGIVDTRAAGTTAQGGNWSITAKMSSDFTNGTNTLKNILYYQGASGSPIAIDSTNDTTIFTQTNPSEGTVPVTTAINWSASGAIGLRLLLPTGTTTTGDYQGTIQWGLNDTY
ncbi:pectate lyase-like adhesive domain-containing protein [Enterococcus sp. LJL120]